MEQEISLYIPTGVRAEKELFPTGIPRSRQKGQEMSSPIPPVLFSVSPFVQHTVGINLLAAAEPRGIRTSRGYTIRKGKTMGKKKKTATACQRNGMQRTLNGLQQDRFQVLKSGLSAFLVPTLVSAEEWHLFF